ncbi:MAG: hypothetical protein R3F61_15115 [Myxococcota bacterium]
MIALLTAAALAQQPWGVGPSPSASRVDKGFAFAAHGAVVGEPWGGRVNMAFAPHQRIWMGAEVGAGSGWRTCPTCGDVAFTGTARVLAIDSTLFKGAAWGSTVATPHAHAFSAGIAAELDIGRFALDTSLPLWVSDDPWEAVRSAPELGARWHWSKHNATRVAVVGLDPDLALTHRLTLGPLGLEATARTTREGPMVEGGIRLQL